MDKKEMYERIEFLEAQAQLDYLEDVEWSFILDMLDHNEYAELKELYIATDNRMHTIMDDRGEEE